jgi:hypothetical protein
LPAVRRKTRPDERAASDVFDILIDPSVVRLECKADGVARIGNVAGLATRLGLDAELLRSDPSSFEEDAELIVPWLITLLIAKHAAQIRVGPILQSSGEDTEARRDAIYGRDYCGRGKDGGWSVSPEICAQVDEEHGKPVSAILREWCGAVKVRAAHPSEILTWRCHASQPAPSLRAPSSQPLSQLPRCA